MNVLPVEQVPEFEESWDQGTTLRILSVNPNGFKYKQDWEFLDIILNGATSIGADIMCLSETNTEWGYRGVLVNLQNKLKTHLAQFRLARSQSPVKFDSAYQPGGGGFDSNM
jgi:hypothetical protein